MNSTLREKFTEKESFLMEGAIGTRLLGEYGLTTGSPIALAAHIYTDAGRAAVGEIYSQYLNVAGEHDLPFLASTPTRRTNRERAPESRHGNNAIADNVEFLRSLIPDNHPPVFVGGTIGCRGNAYTGDGALDNEDDALRFHSWAVERFANAGAEYLYASLMPTLPEAIGLARACSEYAMPYIISFTLRANGLLIDGTPLVNAIHRIDAAVNRTALGYMVNCIHSCVLAEGLAQPVNKDAVIRERFLGIQPNASRLAAEKLDGSENVYGCDPADLARETANLSQWFDPRVLGGCCGTDTACIAALAKLLVKR